MSATDTLLSFPVWPSAHLTSENSKTKGVLGLPGKDSRNTTYSVTTVPALKPVEFIIVV